MPKLTVLYVYVGLLLFASVTWLAISLGNAYFSWMSLDTAFPEEATKALGYPLMGWMAKSLFAPEQEPTQPETDE